ncbi:hypothetical protein PgNI_06209, partial [Pyricularia grisea]|uniref:Uncharacterized protein n=1 Tax=Pyricularia grisea TaxID=148305 RepID=A0A6P8B775_PYRGI
MGIGKGGFVPRSGVFVPNERAKAWNPPRIPQSGLAREEKSRHGQGSFCFRVEFELRSFFFFFL